MDLAKAHTLFSLLGRDRFDLLYSGLFHDEHTPGLITLSEEVVVAGAGRKSLRQRLSFVMVEAYQNIVRHRAGVDRALARGAGRSLFLLRSHEHGNEVAALDPVTQEDAEGLEVALQRIGGSDTGQLKSLFLDRLREGQRSARGGAGLGLIEMARRSENGLRATLLPLDADHQMFLVQIMVGASRSELTTVDGIMDLHALCGELDLLVLCRCGASSTALDIVLQMIGRDLDERAGMQVSRAILSIVEWLRNTPLGADAFIALFNDQDAYRVVFGVAGKADAEQEWTTFIQGVNSLSPAMREQRYRDAMLGRKQMGPEFPLGLLDLARTADGPMEWASFPRSEDRCLLLSARLR